MQIPEDSDDESLASEQEEDEEPSRSRKRCCEDVEATAERNNKYEKQLRDQNERIQVGMH